MWGSSSLLCYPSAMRGSFSWDWGLRNATAPLGSHQWPHGLRLDIFWVTNLLYSRYANTLRNNIYKRGHLWAHEVYLGYIPKQLRGSHNISLLLNRKFSRYQIMPLFPKEGVLWPFFYLFPFPIPTLADYWVLPCLPSEPPEEARAVSRFPFPDPAWGSFFPDNLNRKILPESEFSLSYYFFIAAFHLDPYNFPFACWNPEAILVLSKYLPNTFYDLGTNRWRHSSCFLNRNILNTRLSLN